MRPYDFDEPQALAYSVHGAAVVVVNVVVGDKLGPDVEQAVEKGVRSALARLQAAARVRT